ncbi:sensory neuron membrane protein 1-like [Uranotaenia lowii]|uniref:sensory neuron membrane protein 1-like n=1 Tax=Uranotaenia lowii TaxID=190385 RepID=UPI0024795622|nr:sensory neuron membrane protein 1-like [Uranotaenia lowii]
MKWEEFNYKKIGIISASTLVGGLVFSFGIFPQILRYMVKQQMMLKDGTQMRGMFEKMPFPLDFKIHIFNVSNPEAIMKGGKPKVQEIGPYHFEEWKERFDREDNLEDDTLTFTLRNTFIFRPDKSGSLTGDEMITIPHPIILGSLVMVQREREAMLPLIIKGLSVIFEPFESGFFTVRVMDLLFDGIMIDCSSSDFSVKAVCSGLESEGIIAVHNDTHYSFSLFGTRNATDAGRWVVYRGVKNIRDLGRVISYNDEPEMDTYSGDACNMINGTDSTIFAPFMSREDLLWAWSPDICRSMGAKYVRKAKYAGLPMSYYTVGFGDLKNEPDLHCFCRNPPDDCPPKGTMDLAPCMGGPFLGSKPHFYDSDPELLNAVEGLTPNEKDHDMFIYFELTSGTPVSGVKRLQFNLEIEPVTDNEQFGSLPNVALPFFWVEEGISLNKTWTNQLKYQLFLGLKFNAFVKWFTILLGIVGSVGAGLVFHKQSTSATINVIPITVESAKSDSTRPAGQDNDGFEGDEGNLRNSMVSINNNRNLPPVINPLGNPSKLLKVDDGQRY